MDLSRSIPGADIILERSDNVRKISSLKEVGTVTQPGKYSVDVHYEGTGLLGSSSLRSLRMLFSHKPKDGEAEHFEQKICEQSPQGHYVFTVLAGQQVKWSLEVKSGSLAKGLPVRVIIQRTESHVSHESVAPVSPRACVAPSGDFRLPVTPTPAQTEERDEVKNVEAAPVALEEPAPEQAQAEEHHDEAPAAASSSELQSKDQEQFDDWEHVEGEEEEEEEEGEELSPEEQLEPPTHGATDIVWKEQASVKRGRDAERSTPLLAGFYRLVLQKTDNLAGPKRIISCTLKLTRQGDGTLIKQHTREVGGFRAGRKLIIDFEVKEEDSPAVFTLRAETNAAARVVPVKLTALIMYRGENEPVPEEALKSRSMRPLKRLVENKSKATNLAHAPEGEDAKKDDKSSLLLEVKSVDVLGTKTWHLVLSEGFYYLGVVNVSQTHSGGERKTVTGKLDLVRNDDVHITTMESEPLPQDSLPWKAYFSVSSAQAPAKLAVSVTSHIKGIGTGVRTTLKVKKVPDPYSYDEIKRKTELMRHIAVAAVGALLLLSYAMQLVQFIFSITIPFVRISVRMICTLVAGVYAFQHRDELVEFLRVKMAEGQENLKWLMELDDSDTSIQKLKLLRERQNKKKEEKRRRLERLRQL